MKLGLPNGVVLHCLVMNIKTEREREREREDACVFFLHVESWHLFMCIYILCVYAYACLYPPSPSVSSSSTDTGIPQEVLIPNKYPI